MELNDKIAAVVTGGASGLGAATARRLASKGVKVAIFDLNGDAGEALAKEIGGCFCQADVTDDAGIDKALDKARAAHGQERILINCAGIVAGRKIARVNRETGAAEAHDKATFQKVISINLIGTFSMTAKCTAGMLSLDPLAPDQERGVIVNTSSVAAQDGQIGQLAYAASKGGIAAMTLPIARDLSRDGIRACAIMPGLFHTPMFDALSDEVRDALAASVPFPTRLGHPEEYAALACHIVENPMLNGENIRLDGAIRLAPR